MYGYLKPWVGKDIESCPQSLFCGSLEYNKNVERKAYNEEGVVYEVSEESKDSMSGLLHSVFNYESLVPGELGLKDHL